MASLKEAADVSERIKDLAAQFHDDVTEGRADFADLARFADEIAESADSLAAAFLAIDDALTERPEARETGGRRGGRQTGQAGARRSEAAQSKDEPTKAESRARAQEAGGSGSSTRADEDVDQPLEELSREQLLERARALDVAGRSTMSKDELVEAVRAQEDLSKQDLLDRAREAAIPGRSTMSKEELAEAVRSEESLSREELLERAREADIPGRSGMSKEDLREALRSQ